MNCRKISIALIALLLTSSASLSIAHGLVLTKDGSSDYTIVLTSNASPSEKHAARELQMFLKMISGVTLPVCRDNESISGPMILLGEGGLVRRIAPDIDFKTLGPEGFVLRTAGIDVIIAGGHERGTMYGVYHFLESLGCRWYTKEMSRIPKMTTLAIEEMDRREIPAFEQRMMNWRCGSDANWAARNSQNASAPLGEQRGGSVNYMGSHTSYQLVNPYVHFEAHPEYYAIRNGARQWEFAQVCVTNPEVSKVAAQSLIDWMDREPDGHIYAFTQEDWQNTCGCSFCVAIDGREESPSGGYIAMVNRSAAAVEKVHPEKLVGTFAYHYTEKPPKTVRPRANVNIRMALIEGCDGHPLELCPENEKVAKNVRDWAPISHHTYVWDYTNDFRHLLQPFPNWWSMQEDLRFFKRNGVDGMFLQGNSYTEAGAFSEMQAWIQAHLLWNPATNIFDLIDDYLNGYYGPAAPAMRKIIDLMQNKVRNLENHFTLFSPPTVAYVTPDMIRQYITLFGEAYRAAQGNPEILYRIDESFLMLRYLKLSQTLPHMHEGDLLKPNPAAALYSDIGVRELYDFMEMCNHHEIISLDEWGKMFTRYEAMRENMGTHSILPIENDRFKLEFIPSIGGRMVGLHDKKGNRLLIDGFQSGDSPFSSLGGFRSGPASNEYYFPEITGEPNGTKITFHGFLTNDGHFRTYNSMEESRAIFLPNDKSRLDFNSTLLARKDIGRPLSISAGGSFNLGDGKNLKVAVADASGKLTIAELTRDERFAGRPGGRSANRLSKVIRRRDLDGGKFCIFNTADNYGLVVTFTPDEVESCSMSIDEETGQARISIQGKMTTYKRGDRAALRYSLELNDAISHLVN